MPHNQVGQFRGVLDVSTEYARLAREDEAAANSLADTGHYRHAAYFTIQAIEKHLRAKIFSLVDPNDGGVRDANRNHSVEDAIAFLLDTFHYDPRLRSLVREQFEAHLFSGLRFNLLHNDLRYPTYFERSGGYSCLEVSATDLVMLFARIDWLKDFMSELSLLIRA